MSCLSGDDCFDVLDLDLSTFTIGIGPGLGLAEKTIEAVENLLKNKRTLMITTAGAPKTPLVVSGPTAATNAPASGQVAPGFVLRGAAPTQAQVPPAFMIPRSKTKSPGIGMDGRPIPQWRR